VSKLGDILVHGVALKPGKPLCLAVIDGKPLAVLPGFPPPRSSPSTPSSRR